MPRRRERDDYGPEEDAPPGRAPLIALAVVGGTAAAGIALAGVLLVAGVATAPPPEGARGRPPAPAPAPPPAPEVREVKLGEQVREGDLLISIPEVVSKQCAGQYFGQFSPINLTVVKVVVTNTGKGKIADWPGWHGKAALADEHGNRFSPVGLRGWDALPHNDTLGGGWDGDTGARINPGQTYVNALYHEPLPPTSKEVTVTAPLGGRVWRFRGPAGHWK